MHLLLQLIPVAALQVDGEGSTGALKEGFDLESREVTQLLTGLAESSP